MSRRWIRLDTTWSQSEWLAELEPEHRLVWIELLCYAKAHGTDGNVKVSNVALQRVTGVTRYAVDKLVTAAIEHGALETVDGMWVITEWKTYQGDPTNKTRQKRYRDNAKGLTPTVTNGGVTGVTRYDSYVTPTETETETKKNTYTSDFEDVWKIHRKGSKPKAGDAYRKALKKTQVNVITNALKAYVATLRPPTFTGVHLHRWLDEERWEEMNAPSPTDAREHLERQLRMIHG